MPQPAILPVYVPLSWLISNLKNFTLVPHPNHCKLIWKSPKKFGQLVTKPQYSLCIAQQNYTTRLHLLTPIITKSL